MTKGVHTTPPPDAAARRRALPVLTYSVEQLPLFDAAFYNNARDEATKVGEVMVIAVGCNVSVPQTEFPARGCCGAVCSRMAVRRLREESVRSQRTRGL